MLPIPVISVVGSSNSGKTTVAVGLIHELTSRGFAVAAIKHCPHGHDLDRRGSDSNRLLNAGAVTSIASSPGMTTQVVLNDQDLSLETLVDELDGRADLVVAEGYTRGPAPKVLVRGGDRHFEHVDNIIAVVEQQPGHTRLQSGPSESELAALADRVLERLGLSVVVSGHC